jgi:hypothetical protein
MPMPLDQLTPVFWSLFLGLISISTQLTGHLVLAIAMAFLEVLDNACDVKGIEAALIKVGTPLTVLYPATSSN